MLTITETTDAIKALDTDPDIIIGACKNIFFEHKQATPEEVSTFRTAENIVNLLTNNRSPTETVELLGTVTAIIVRISVRGSNHGETLKLLNIMAAEKIIQTMEAKIGPAPDDDSLAAITKLKRFVIESFRDVLR